MPALVLDAVHKHFGLKPLLDDVSFSLEDDGKMGVIGANGSGKTTLLRLAAGLEPPDAGRVMRPRTQRIGYLSQEPAFTEGRTVLDAVFAGEGEAMRLLRDYEAAVHRLDASGGADEQLVARVTDLAHRLDAAGGWNLETNARAVLDRLGITDTDALVETLSGGQRKRVALARALVEAPDLLILDEPTNHLDAETVGWLEAYLERFTGALLLVTHDRYFLDRVTDRMLELDRGTAQRYEGNYTAYLEKKAEQTALREAEEQKRANLARRELAWLRRGAKARTTKQKARVDRAHALLDASPAADERTVAFTTATTRLGSRVVELTDVTKGYDDRTLLDGFTYAFTRDDRVGIIGPNGAGKTTLLDLIAGRVAPDAGRVAVGQTVSIGYYDQESRALDDDLRVIDSVTRIAENVRTSDGALVSASQMLDRFLFPPAQQYQPVGLLSGGERRRLYLLHVLMGAPNVLLLDEPTNDLDIPTLVALEDYLETFAGCLVAVSHDRYFLDRTVDHLFRFEEDGRLREIPGNYSAFLELQEREAAQAAPPDPVPKQAPVSAPVRTSEPDGEPRKLSYRERRELEALEASIASDEARQAAIESELSTSPDDYERLTALAEELDALQRRLEAAVDRWADLAERA